MPFRELDISAPDEKKRRASYHILHGYIEEMATCGVTTGIDPQDEIRRAGSRLLAIHASDSIDRGHDHLVPARGELRWDDIITSLVNVGYTGVFTMEVYGPRVPSLAASIDLIRSSYEIGRSLTENI